MSADTSRPMSGGSFMQTGDLPSAFASEALMADDAPAALAFLRRHDALDLAPMLGLGDVA
ncbi:hypothetical protein [Nocardioides sp.]|uniref:hypothetical protein n=1 Tax=Nocardioides sp. TaxID=35761 RepID=UPI003512154C